MFIKIVIILLLLIVAASLLTGRGRGLPAAQAAGSRSGTSLRTLMLRMAIVLLVSGALWVIFHLTRN